MKKYILIVDDDKDIRDILSLHLKDELRIVYTAADGSEALEIIAENGMPDLIITDLQMPNIDGYEFLKILGEKYKNHNTHLIILTKYDDVAAKISGFKAGAVRYITKPFLINKALATIHNVLYNFDNSSINLIEHYPNFNAFKTSSDKMCLIELFGIISQQIEQLTINIEKKNLLRANVKLIFDKLTDLKMENNKVYISYSIIARVFCLILQFDDKKILTDFLKILTNLGIDLDISANDFFIKISAKY